MKLPGEEAMEYVPFAALVDEVVAERWKDNCGYSARRKLHALPGSVQFEFVLRASVNRGADFRFGRQRLC